MADLDGNVVTRAAFGGGTRGGRPLNVVTTFTGGSGGVRAFYKMQGLNTDTGLVETWVTVAGPSTTAPVGPCVNVKIAARWEV